MSGAPRDKVNDRSSATGSAKAPAEAIAERAANLRQLLSDRTGDAEPAVIVRAPGRVNLIGEYTDFNLGFVLPAAIDLEVWIAFVPWDRPQVELTSVEMGETMSFSLGGLVKPDRRERTWIDYARGEA
jgi:galactokinase